VEKCGCGGIPLVIHIKCRYICIYIYIICALLCTQMSWHYFCMKGVMHPGDDMCNSLPLFF